MQALILAGIIGLATGCGSQNKAADRPDPASQPAGASVRIVIGERHARSDPSATVDAESTFCGNRALSWFGQSPIQAVEKRLGFSWGKGGLSFGGAKGYGILESLWDTIKDVFWFGLFGMGVLVVLAFIPVTAPIARAILRGIASIFPLIGSLVERIRAAVAYQKPLAEVVAGGDEFKRRVLALPTVPGTTNAVDRQAVLDAFAAAHDSEQDHATQDTVDDIRKA